MSHTPTSPPTVLFDFSGSDLDRMVAACAHDALLSILTSTLPAGASVLEAGAGSGRWVKALSDRGYAMTGLELNPDSVAAFRQAYPQIAFDHGDVARLPYADDQFDGLMSLGVIEHLLHGSEDALSESWRVLKPGGRLILTVPHDNLSFRLERLKDAALYRLYSSPPLRRLLGKSPLGLPPDQQACHLTMVKAHRRMGLPIKYSFTPDSGITFYEYRYTTQRLLALLQALPFDIDDVRILYPEERLYQIFGRLVGHYDGSRPPELSRLGRWILRLVPSGWVGHMLLVSARKREG